MKEICKNSEIASFLDAAWHDPIKETPNKDGALCIVCDGVDENGKACLHSSSGKPSTG